VISRSSGLKSVAIIQARMNSSRLPGKVLKQVSGRPLISFMYERVSSSEELDYVVVATSQESSDDPIYEYCIKHAIPCQRGSLDDVLDRYYTVAEMMSADIVVRLTGDCPVIAPKVIDELVKVYKKGGYDYVANTAPPDGVTFPEGMDVEVFSMAALKRAWNEAKKPSDREHVTFYFWKNPDIFSCYRYDLEEDYSMFRLTVDYPQDFELIEKILMELYEDDPLFTMREIICYLEKNPLVRQLNADIESFSGWKPSLDRDIEQGFSG